MADVVIKQGASVSTVMSTQFKDSGAGYHMQTVHIGNTASDPIETVVPTTSTPYSVTLTLANTEYSQALPNGCRAFEFQCRTLVDVRWAFVTGKVAGSTDPYRTLKAGAAYHSFDLYQATGSTLYFASSTAGSVVELLAWT